MYTIDPVEADLGLEPDTRVPGVSIKGLEAVTSYGNPLGDFGFTAS